LLALLADDGDGILPNTCGAELLYRALGFLAAVENGGCNALTHEILLFLDGKLLRLLRPFNRWVGAPFLG
jgi:hypothetical protein